ncbi:MAG: HAD-IA family hydrolase [Anaerolineales bacterium]|nr:HAD-IA family hydrolase [Anaerolineales bacterium]
MMRALLFDFDGLILDTETPIFRSWQELYRSYGFELSFDLWATTIGSQEAEFNPYKDLERLLECPVDWQVVDAQRAAREMELIEQESLLPGVVQYLEDARRLGVRVGLASSSTREWVVGHLTRRGLLDYFKVLRTMEDVTRTKPDPELFISALAGLGIPAKQAIVLEDSPNGILAAKRAGIFAVAVPGALTRQLALDHADLQLESLAALPLAELLRMAEKGAGAGI